MKRTLQDKMYDALQENFRTAMPGALTDTFGDLGFETRWSISNCAVVTNWTEKVTPKKRKEIQQFISAYETGYGEAMERVLFWHKPE